MTTNNDTLLTNAVPGRIGGRRHRIALEKLEAQIESERTEPSRFSDGRHWTKALRDENRMLLAHYHALREENEALLGALKGMVHAYGGENGMGADDSLNAWEDAKLLITGYADRTG